jgi:hypothetical protein
MSEHPTDLVDTASAGGISGDHLAPEKLPARVGASTGDEKNTLRDPLVVVACWRMDDIRFEFDSSFIGPSAKEEFELLSVLVKRHAKAPLSVFGHADPVGDDAYNKKLSGRRATAVYALLTRNTDLWEKLYSNQEGTNDKWGLPAIDMMKQATGSSAGGGTPGERTTLFKAYMDAICKDIMGADFKLDPADFLGKGEDAKGKGDRQGCSEFNPVLMFSKEENSKYEKDQDKTARNQDNSPNRRVVIFLFKPGSRIDAAKWPCPTVDKGTGDCEKRFWSDAKKRRKFQEQRRLYEVNQDTFACRFYDRIASGSSCECARKLVSAKVYFQRFPGNFGTDEERGIADVPYKLRVTGIPDREGKTAKDGSVKIVMPPDAAAVLEIFGTKYEVTFKDALKALDTIDGAQERLDMLGYHLVAFDGTINWETDHALLQFQVDNGLAVDGDAELAAGRTTKIAQDIQDKLKLQVGE